MRKRKRKHYRRKFGIGRNHAIMLFCQRFATRSYAYSPACYGLAFHTLGVPLPGIPYSTNNVARDASSNYTTDRSFSALGRRH
jgi:hypothetical protein